MKRTNLVWDQYKEYLIEAIDESKFMRRAETKPMSTPKAASESHVTSRAIHSRMVANIAKRLAEGLNLNGDYIYAGMLMHDAGHPFSAHEGEEIFSLIGELYNCGFFHHNAKGVEVVRSENIMQKAINKIPNIRNNPQLREKLEQEFPYFLDVIISHDGEASRRERRKTAEHYDSIAEAVDTKLMLANSQDNYKFVAQTPEGRLAKMADVIAYMATDILDGFRIGVIKDFDDDYLELFGKMFTSEYSGTREENIACAKNILQEIKEEKLRELKSDVKDDHNKSILKSARDIVKMAEERGIEINSMSEEDRKGIDKILAEKIEKMKANEEGLTEEEKQFLNSDISKLKDFVEKMISVHSDVVQEITSRMQEYFISDILANSQGKEEAQFSQKGENLFDKLKELNYKKIVQFSKWDYQSTKQPEAAKKLVDDTAKSLIKTGVIRDKFYDGSIRSKLSEEETKKMKVSLQSEEQYLQYREEIGVRTIGTPCTLPDTKYTTSKDQEIKMHKNKLFKDVYSYVQKEGENFAVKYKNVYAGIPTTVRKNVEKAFTEDIGVLKSLIAEEKEFEEKTVHIEELKKRTNTKSLLREFQLEEIKAMQERITDKYGTMEEAMPYKEEIINDIIQQEREKMDEKMAKQLAIDYIAGMTDSSFNDLAIKTGYMEHTDLINSKRSKRPSESVVTLLEKNAKEERGR